MRNLKRCCLLVLASAMTVIVPAATAEGQAAACGKEKCCAAGRGAGASEKACCAAGKEGQTGAAGEKACCAAKAGTEAVQPKGKGRQLRRGQGHGMGQANEAGAAAVPGACGGSGCFCAKLEEAAAQGEVVPLADAEKEALAAALADERRAQAEYKAVIAKFGDVLPFKNIVMAEGRHIAALETIYARHGLALPVAESTEKTVDYASLAEACKAGVAAEKANVAIYDRLLPQVSSPMLKEAFTNLRAASLEHHLPAFERNAARLSQ